MEQPNSQADIERGITPNGMSFTIDVPGRCAQGVTVPNLEEILTISLSRRTAEGSSQRIIAAGALSASICSQLFPNETSSSTCGAIAHTLLLCACIIGIWIAMTHVTRICASDTERPEIWKIGSPGGYYMVLAWISMSFTMIGIVLLAWAIQPVQVAAVVTGVFASLVCIRAVRWGAGCLPDRTVAT
ncbi:hypothetical protein BD410DRAFT_795819 [Rickenella mellea]|uniref:Uncharacterized protein n=1 Tax=Rickenella mellea TaxID=50990 RepID=A0A4Y7PKM1_9AGAM|nr:hypothetical protein BD410DRAFT_795819 [Rickenella mellea]